MLSSIALSLTEIVAGRSSFTIPSIKLFLTVVVVVVVVVVDPWPSFNNLRLLLDDTLNRFLFRYPWPWRSLSRVSHMPSLLAGIAAVSWLLRLLLLMMLLLLLTSNGWRSSMITSPLTSRSCVAASTCWCTVWVESNQESNQYPSINENQRNVQSYQWKSSFYRIHQIEFPCGVECEKRVH